MPLGLPQPAAGCIDRHMLADARDDILQRSPLGQVIKHVVDGDQRDEGFIRDGEESREAALVIAAIEHRGGEPDGSLRGGVLETLKNGAQLAGIDPVGA